MFGYLEPPSAAAYTRTTPTGARTPARWATPRIHLTVNGSAHSPLAASVGLSSTLQRAANAWSISEVDCSAVQITTTVSSELTEAAVRDGVNRVVFHRREWCRDGARQVGTCYDPRIAAVTTLYYSDHTDAAGERLIEEADIELNAVHFSWTEGAVGSQLKPHSQRVDLQTVLVHEVGHVLGFAHACTHAGSSRRAELATCTPEISSVMFPSADQGLAVTTAQHKLFDDDRRGVCAVYPARPAPRARLASFSCSVASRPRTSRNMAWLFATFAGWLAARRLAAR